MKKILFIITAAMLITSNLFGCVQIIKDSDGEKMYGVKRPKKDEGFLPIYKDDADWLIDDEFNIQFKKEANTTPIRLEDGSYQIYEDKILVYDGHLLDDVKRTTPVILEYKDETGHLQRYMHNLMLKKGGKTYLRRANISEFLSDDTLNGKTTVYATKSVLKKTKETITREIVRFVPYTRTVSTYSEIELEGDADEVDKMIKNIEQINEMGGDSKVGVIEK